MQPGQRFFLLRQRVDRGIVGAGRITSMPYPGKRGERKLFVNIEFDTLLPANDRLLFEDLPGKDNSSFWNQIQASGVNVPTAIAQELELLWAQHLCEIGRNPPKQRAATAYMNGSKVWRMSFRQGDGGTEMWPRCYEAGVAALTYRPLADVDLKKMAPREPTELWTQLSSSQRFSLRAVAYEMQEGDVVYVKQGKRIVGSGVVIAPYQHDRSRKGCVIDDDGNAWRHQVKVAWQRQFEPITIQVGDQQRYTVRQLSNRDIELLNSERRSVVNRLRTDEASEGERFEKWVTFRRRNRALIAAKKAISDGRCAACNFDFRGQYGSMGEACIVAHHNKPIGRRRKANKTTLDDLSLVCANCHAMLHTSDPPLLVSELARRLKHIRA